MSELVKYPTALPLPLLAGHSIQKKTGVLTSKMESGHSRRRRRFKNVPLPVPVKFLFSSDEYAVFENWFEIYLNDGLERFVMPVKTSTGIQYQTAEFSGDGYKATPKSSRLWHITAKLEIHKLDMLDPVVFNMLINLSYPLSSLNKSLIALEKAVNENNLSNL